MCHLPSKAVLGCLKGCLSAPSISDPHPRNAFVFFASFAPAGAAAPPNAVKGQNANKHSGFESSWRKLCGKVLWTGLAPNPPLFLFSRGLGIQTRHGAQGLPFFQALAVQDSEPKIWTKRQNIRWLWGSCVWSCWIWPLQSSAESWPCHMPPVLGPEKAFPRIIFPSFADVRVKLWELIHTRSPLSMPDSTTYLIRVQEVWLAQELCHG